MCGPRDDLRKPAPQLQQSLRSSLLAQFLDPGFRNGPPGRAQEFGSYCPLRKMSAAKGKVAKVATVEGKVQKMKLMELVQRTIMCKFFRAGRGVKKFTIS